MKRRPQPISPTGSSQAPCPTITISGEAMPAPTRPSQFSTGSSEAAIQLGSSGV